MRTKSCASGHRLFFALVGLMWVNIDHVPAEVFTADVVITAQVVKRNVNPYDYCCVNWDMGFGLGAHRQIFSTPDRYKEFIRFLRDDVSLRCFRYPGGSYVTRFFFGVPAEKWHKPSMKGKPSGWIEVEEFFKFLKDGDFRTFLQVNTVTWFDQTAGEIKPLVIGEKIDQVGLKWSADAVEKLARWIKKNNYQPLIRYWEIGNEDYIQPNYAKIAGTLIRRIKKVLPDARIIVVNQVALSLSKGGKRYDKWSAGVLKNLTAQGLKSQIDGVTAHVYAFSKRVPRGRLANSTAYQEYAAAVSFLPDDPFRQPWGELKDHTGKRVSVVGLQADTLDLCGYKNAPIFYTEWRLPAMQERYNKALANGIGHLHLLAGFVGAPRVGGACIHSLLHGSRVTRGKKGVKPRSFNIWGYNIVHYQADDDLRPRFVSTPTSEGFNLIWKLACGDVLEVKSSSDLLFPVATREGRKVRLLVINKAARPLRPEDVLPNKWGWKGAAIQLSKDSEKGDRFRVTITLPGEFKTGPYVNVYTLGESELLSDYSADPGTYDVHEIKMKSARIAFSGKLKYTFAPHSAVLFEFDLEAKAKAG